jgi:acyl-CoA thioesterase FadM
VSTSSDRDDSVPADPHACPFGTYETTVAKAWVDYNGHMTDSAYSVVCSAANEAFLAALDLSSAYQLRTGRATYTVESRLRYLREAMSGDTLRAETVLVRADAKRLLVHTALLDEHSRVIATGEYLFLHVNQATDRVEPFDDTHAELIRSVAMAHETWQRPEYIGHGVWADKPKQST